MTEGKCFFYNDVIREYLLKLKLDPFWNQLPTFLTPMSYW